MSDIHAQAIAGDAGGRVALVTTTGFMVAGILLLFILFVFAFFLFLRTKHYWGTIPGFGQAISGGFPAAESAEVPAAGRRQGLDPTAVKALASLMFRPEDFPEGLECAVCLSDLSCGEAVRRLPKCGHGFHLECIDMWFHSHSNCPVCRCPVIADSPQNAGSSTEIVEAESREAAATVGESPIEPSSPQIPTAATNPMQQEESIANSPSSLLNSRWIPAIEIARLPASMRRLLMHGRGPRVSDLEQGGGGGGGGLSGPKTPPASS